MSQERFVSSVEATPLDNVTWSPRPGFSMSETPRFTTSYHVWNYTTSVLSVSDRFGMSYLSRPLNSNTVQRTSKQNGKQFQPGFYFTIEYRQLVDRRSHRVEETQFDSRCVLNQSNPNPILRSLKGNSEILTDRNGDTWEIHYIDFFVNEEVVSHAQDCVYLQNLDLLISTKSSTDMLPHLFSEEGSKLRAEYHPTSTPLPSGGLQIVHVDNSRRHPTYFTNLGGIVVDIEPVQDFNLQSGFYLYQCRTKKDNFGRTMRDDPKVTFFTYEEMLKDKSKLRLWLTYAEAETLGNLDKQKEEEFKERERQWQKEKFDMEQQTAKNAQEIKEKEQQWQKEKFQMEQEDAKRKQAHEAEKAQWQKEKFDMEKEKEARDAELARIKAIWEKDKLDADTKLQMAKQRLAELEAELKAKQMEADRKQAEFKNQMDQKSAERKDYYESRSSSRKDSSEGWITGLKIAGTVIAVGVAAFKLFF